MTSNQLTYWRDKEQKRTNLENENIKRQTVGEDVRHNKENELLANINAKINERNANTQETDVIAKHLTNILKGMTGGGFLGGISSLLS